MHQHLNFRFNEKKFRWLGIPLLAFFIMFVVKHNVFCLTAPFWVEYLITLVFTFFIWNSSYMIVKYFRKKMPSLADTKKRILTSLLLTTAAAVIITILLSFLFFNLMAKQGEFIFDANNLFTCILSNSFVLSVYEGLYFFERWNDAMVSAEELKKVNVQSQFDSLKNQVNPHFLFNSLNTLSSLVEEDSKQAVSFIHKMSNVYRYLLQGNEKSVTTVRNELEFIESYVYMLKTRFEDSLKVVIQVPEEAKDKFIPPHTLQMLVENAVKHNEVSNDHPLTVKVYIEDDFLIVSNNLQRKNSLVKSNGVGLQNILQRYELLGDRQVIISEDEHNFLVKVPLFNTTL